MRIRKGLASVAVLTALLCATPSQAAVITFDGTTGFEALFNTPYAEAGYTLTPGPDLMFFMDAAVRAPVFPGLATFSGDVLEFNDVGTHAGFTLVPTGGGVFDLTSVTTGSLGRRGFQDDGDFVFTGTLWGGGTISVIVPALSIPQTFPFVGFTSLTSLTVSSLDGSFPVLDDLVLSEPRQPVVPEPGSLLLLGTALVGVGVRRFGRGRA